jgi:plastocyanin
VTKGTTVTFTFQSVEHNVVFAAATGAPANIGNTSNGAVARDFATAGTFGFDCTIHSGMHGSVTVN